MKEEELNSGRKRFKSQMCRKDIKEERGYKAKKKQEKK
jgi:hypothetical protein